MFELDLSVRFLLLRLLQFLNDLKRTIILCLGMRSERSPANWSVSAIMVTDIPTERLGIEGDLGRIAAWACVCKYKAGFLGDYLLNILKNPFKRNN